MNCTAFSPKLDSDTEGGIFDRERTWSSKAVEAALRDGVDPDILWTKEDLVFTRDARYGDAWKDLCNTPLHLAILDSDHDSAEIILRYGGNVNIYNHQGHTALHEAIDHQQEDDVWFLIRHGADPNKPSRDGHVPLHLALRNGDEELFFDLLQHGASLQAAAHFEWSIVDLALLASEKGISARLMSHEHAMLPTPMLDHSESRHQFQSSKFSAAASKLLAVFLSDRILPPKDLYETYQFLLHSLHIPKHVSWDAEAVDSLTESFIASLYKASNIPSLAATERLCPACVAFQSVAARCCRRRITIIDDWSGPTEIHKDKAELEECALAGCPLCALVADWVYDESDRPLGFAEDDGTVVLLQIEDESFLESSPITLQVGTTSRFPPGELSPRVDSVHADLANSRYNYVSFQLEGFDVSFGAQEDESSHIHSTGSSRALGVAKQWLEDCRTSPAHNLCREAYGKISSGPFGPLPTRVLHVGSEHQDPYLFESNGIKASYCILSYCWGRPGNAITTKTNISERIKGIPLTSLPTLLRQAVLTARALRFDYIWIDALCIIQDDEEDWAREASVMHELYSRADLTITSLVAGDSRDDLFQPRPRRICRPIPLKLGLMLPKRDRPRFKEGSVVELAVHPKHAIAVETPVRGPVHQRAWTLQEQAMSIRILYFGAGLLHWECLHDYRLEPYPCWEGNAPNINRNFYKNRHSKLITKGLPPLEGVSLSLDDQGPFEVWQAQVQEFTRRQMTRPSDRIPAFLAISKSIAMVLKDEFVGGIWKGDNHLLESLCWRLQQPDTTDPTGPTWTWASRSGEVSYDLLEHDGKKPRKALVVSCDAEANRPQSQVFGSITLKGTLKLVQYDFSHGTPGYVYSDHVFGSEQKHCCCVFDMISFGDPPPLAYDVDGPLREDKEKGRICLLLQPIDGNGDFRTASAFRRVGIEFRPWQDRKWHAKLAQRMLSIHRPPGSASQMVASEDDTLGLRNRKLNRHASRQLPDPIEGIDQDIPPSVEDKARPEETSNSSSDNDDHVIMGTVRRRETKGVQTNRIVTIF